MKKYWKTLCFVFLISASLGSAVLYSKADNISDAEREKKQLEEKKASIEARIEELESGKEGVVQYIEKLDGQLSELNTELETLEGKISTENSNLKTTQKELEAATKTEENQYATMKKRIKYMYENGNQDYLEILYSSESIADFLNRTEYISKISEYDNTLFQRYKESKELVETKKQEVEAKLAKLKLLQEEKAAEQEGIQILVNKKNSELTKYDNDINANKEEVQSYVDAIEEQEKKIEQLIEEERKKAEAQGYEGFVEVSGSSGFIWPLPIAGRISSKFGPRSAPTKGASTYHKGLDIAAPTGTHILAAKAGKVVTARYSSSAGNFVMISHGKGLYTVYMHAVKLNVKAGQNVKQGEVVAFVGSTGFSTGSHLHFGVIKNGKYVNPINYVKQR